MALIQCNFFSKALMRTVPIQVVLPTDKMVFPGQPQPEEKPFKTLYLLHGIFGNYTDWVCGTRIQAWAQDRNLAVVMHPSFLPALPEPGGHLHRRPLHGRVWLHRQRPAES